jgi:hypothetical protein
METFRSGSFLWIGAVSAILAACAAPPRDQPVGDRPTVEGNRPTVEDNRPPGSAAAPAAPASPAYRPGVGTIESAAVLSLSSAPAAAGGTAGPGTSATMAYRLKMADGTAQDVVQAGERFEVGERVEMTREGRLVRP